MLGYGYLGRGSGVVNVSVRWGWVLAPLGLGGKRRPPLGVSRRNWALIGPCVGAAHPNLRAVTVRQRIDQLAAEPPVRDLGYAADQRLVAGALLGLQLLADEIDALKAGRVVTAETDFEDDGEDRYIADDRDIPDDIDASTSPTLWTSWPSWRPRSRN